MASGSEVVGIEIVAKVDGLKAELSRLAPGMEKEAKAMVAALERELKRAEKAAKSAAAESRAAGQAVKGLGDAAGKTGQSAAKLAGFLSLVSPEAAEAARSVADLADVGEVGAEAGGALGVSLTAAGAAVAALSAAAIVGYGVWSYYAVEAAHAAQVQERLNAVMAEGERVASRLGDITIDIGVETGALTQEQAKYERSVKAATKAHEERAAAIAKESGLTEQQVKAAVAAAAHSEEAAKSQSEAQKKAVQLTAIANAEYSNTVVLYGTLRDAETERRKAADAKTEAEKRAAAASRDVAAATKAAEDATRAQTEALRESQAAMADDSARAASVASALNSMASAQTAATTAGLEGADRLVAARDAELAQLEATYQAGVAAADSDAQRTALASQYASARVAIEEDAQRQMQAAIAQTAAAEQAARKAAVQSYANSFGQISAAAAAFGDLMTEEQRDAAMRLYRISKAAAITEATLNAVLAVSEASTIPYPANLLAMAAAGAMGAANVATIAATPPPSFHIGTSAVGDGARVDEINARLQYREAVASRQGADILGRDNIDRANSGRVPRYGGDAPAVIRYRHKEYNEFIRDNIRQGGPLRDALTAGSTVGHRTNRG